MSTYPSIELVRWAYFEMVRWAYLSLDLLCWAYLRFELVRWAYLSFELVRGVKVSEDEDLWNVLDCQPVAQRLLTTHLHIQNQS